jgi:hypothetical protein
MKKTDFRFLYAGYGAYYIIYTSPKTQKQYKAYSNNMPLLDATKNTENPKIKDLQKLKRVCKEIAANFYIF